MSGAEIAGLLLAGPPLIISWLEHYREVFEMLDCWRSHRAQYRKAETQLQALELSMDMTIENLFLPYVDDHDELERLKKDRKNSAWIEVERKLSTRLLPETYTVYTYLLRDLQDAHKELAQELHYDAVNQPNSLTMAGIDERLEAVYQRIRDRAQRRLVVERERLRFSTRGEQREQAVRKVQTLLDQVKSLLVQNDDTVRNRAQQSASRSKSHLRSNLLHFWRHARAVYDLVYKTWSCTCQPQHYADLLLSPVATPEVRFELRLHYDRAGSVTGAPPWSAQPAQITRIDWPSSQNQQQVRRGVRFAPISGSSAPQLTLEEVSNLCRALGKATSTQKVIGVLAGHGYDGAYSVSLLERPGPSATLQLTSLGDLLRRNTWERPPRKERYRIAAIVASSHLQLHSSGWLLDGWRKDHIFFMPRANGELGRPYLRKGFGETLPASKTPTFDVAIATLGIVLLELCFGYTLESTPFWKTLTDGTSDLVQDRAAAWDWAELVEGEADERYKHAVYWCLEKWKVRSEDDTWRQDFHQVVVEPLRAEAGIQ